MLILEENADGMAIVRTRPARPLWIAGCLFAALGVLPFLPAGVTLPRLATGLFLCGVGLVLVLLGRPKRTREALPAGRGGRSAVAAVVLTGGSAELEVYRAELLLKDGSRRLVLERSEPGGVVRDALRLAGQLGVPVEPGWGLDHHMLAQLDGSRSAPARALLEPVTSIAFPFRRQHIAAVTTIWGGAFVFVIATAMTLSPYRPIDRPSALSIVLPALSVVAVLAVGFWLLGLRERLVVDSTGVTRDRLLFGRPMGPRQHFPGAISGIFPVSPEPGPILHVLVGTQEGAVAFPADSDTGLELARHDPAFDGATGRAAE
jgi:hypothetical protein